MILSAIVIAIVLGQAPIPHPPEHPVLAQFYRPPTYGPILSDVSMSTGVRSTGAAGGSVTMPLPSDYSGQIVIGFRVECDPPEALQRWKWVDRADGLNRLLQVSLSPGATRAKVTYTARILTPGEDVVRTERKDFPSWLVPTPLVPSRLPLISSVAKRLAEGADEREKLVHKVVMWVAHNKSGVDGTPFRFRGDPQGDSCPRARLCAAILRNLGVPARIVEYVPTWAENIDATFWLVQYGSDDENWQAIDPTVGIVEPSRDTLVVESICSLEDEARSSPADWPHMSAPEASPGLRFEASGAASTFVTLIRSFPWQTGGRIMTGALARSAEVAQSAHAGKPEWFDEATFNRVLAGGPINLALYLGGRQTLPGHG